MKLRVPGVTQAKLKGHQGQPPPCRPHGEVIKQNVSLLPLLWPQISEERVYPAALEKRELDIMQTDSEPDLRLEFFSINKKKVKYDDQVQMILFSLLTQGLVL